MNTVHSAEYFCIQQKLSETALLMQTGEISAIGNSKLKITKIHENSFFERVLVYMFVFLISI